MKIAGVLPFVASAFAASAAFGQSSPDNVASDSFQKRLQSMNLLSASRPRIIKRVAPTGMCATPLLSVTPSAALDTKMVVTPRANPTPGDELVNVPAPACEK